MSDDRVGAGRSYVHLPKTLTYDAWCDGVRDGRSYVSDGFGHLMDFTANGSRPARPAASCARGAGPVTSDRASRVSASRRGAERPFPIRDQPPFWTPEHARIAASRDVTVEAIVNGRPAAARGGSRLMES